MATLQAIRWNLAVGASVSIVSLVAFSAAVYWEWNAELAPRTFARPRQVIKNILKGPAIFYGFSWIPWTLGLNYKQMMLGIEGTGTRANGWAGSMLKCNLDGIVAIKFHAMCFKVAVFATFLCICFILPINITAKCDPLISGEALCTNMTRLTNFEITTLAHIPPMDFIAGTSGSETNQDTTTLSDITIASLERYFSTSPGITSRLFAIVICTWAIFIYTCYLIWNEWIDNLALRRVFYLELDHNKERKAELLYLETLVDPEPKLQQRRPPNIPHPEVRDTVPNVALYSALYKLPEHFKSTKVASNSSMLDRQLSSTIDFFHRAVPNHQTRFTSSVAAVTILPDPSQVATAWKKWMKCAKGIRRLRFIRLCIRDREAMKSSQNVGLRDAQREGGENDEEIEFYDMSSSLVPSAISTESEAHQSSISPPTTSPTRRSPSPRHNYSKMATLEEQCGGMSSSEFFDDPDLSNQVDIESAEDLEIGKSAGATELAVDIAGRTMAFSPHSDDTYISENGTFSATVGQNQLTSKSRLDSNHGNIVVASNQVYRELTPLFSGTSGSPTDSWIPSVRTGSLSPQMTNEGDFAAFDWQQRPSRFDKRQSSPEKVGLVEEAKLDMFLSDHEMEQLSVYCRESAQSSATCCPYGGDYHHIMGADLATLKELEEEAEEMVGEANLELIEVRASVNKTELDIHSDERPSGGILISPDGQILPSLRTNIDGHSSDNTHAAADERVVEESKIESTACSKLPSPCDSMPNGSVMSERQWRTAGEIANENRAYNGAKGRKVKLQKMPSGRWHFDFGETFVRRLQKYADQQTFNWFGLDKAQGKGNAISRVIDQQTYAVVTFTSRQAAIIARQCMADGSGLGRWEEMEDLPVPPLADSPPWDFCTCRACCRPVTLTINDSQKRCRRNCTWLCLFFFCSLYTIPLAWTSSFLSSQQFSTAFPNLKDELSGILTGLLYTGFFSVCPFIFMSFANFGSGATSQRQAEERALRYYWIFILVTAFTGSSLATMLRSGLYSDLNLGESAQEVLRQVANSIPTQVSATWLNWMIVKCLFSIPASYLLQTNTFLFLTLGLNCCSCTRGGGPGSPLPYRIYVDCGAVFLCIVALAPACPLVAPAALLYFMVFSPVLRWLLIFVYRPQYDGGGQRWPLLHEILISSMIVAQVLLTTMMVLKKAYGPAFLAALSIVPTFLFGRLAKIRFLKCYMDAGLYQTNQLDGLDESQPISSATLEEFRKWLVDCHKAAYVPICLAGADSFLTAEPAVVLPDQEIPSSLLATNQGTHFDFDRRRTETMDSTFVAPGSIDEEIYFYRRRMDTMESAFLSALSSNRSNGSQRGALHRRVPHSEQP